MYINKNELLELLDIEISVYQRELTLLERDSIISTNLGLTLNRYRIDMLYDRISVIKNIKNIVNAMQESV